MKVGVLFALLVAVSGCAHQFSAGARVGLSTEGTVSASVPLAMGVPVALEWDDATSAARQAPAQVLVFGITLIPRLIGLGEENDFQMAIQPFLQYQHGIKNHSVGVALRGGQIMHDDELFGGLGFELQYQAPLSQSWSSGIDNYLNRNRLGFTVGVDWSPVGTYLEDAHHEWFFTFGISWIYEQMFERGDSTPMR